MNRVQRIILGAAVFFMSLGLVFPLWRIELYAPQYPEGLVMQILANRMIGDVTQINILNHYVGMKYIVPDEIPELALIPWILAGLVLLGILVIILKKMKFARLWLVLVNIACFGGLVDLYLWGYDYGHNLSPNAPIKMPGMSYQPPLIGSKTLLNIQAYSLPDWGGYALTIGLVLAFVAVFWDFLSSRRGRLGILCLMMASCTAQPEALKEGVDYCTHCHMKVTDARFGGVITTEKGRSYKFDSVACLQSYRAQPEVAVKSVFLADYFHPEKLVKASEAYLLEGSKIVGPMGSDVIATKDEVALKELQKTKEGQFKKWEELSHRHSSH